MGTVRSNSFYYLIIAIIGIPMLIIFLNAIPTGPSFTLNDFYECKEGMSYNEVTGILGGEGKSKLVDRSNPDHVLEQYEWKSSKGGYTTMYFVNNKLANKQEYQLATE